jgi:hypothetical protein
MTLVMYDSIYPANLPAGADAYLGYVNGEWPTCATIKAQFPGADFVCLSVTGATTVADGIDVESGDYTQAEGVAWVQQAIAGGAPSPPVWYQSASDLNASLSALAAAGIQRSQVRLLSAHYDWTGTGGPEHICGPSTCGLVSVACDGTQWTDTAAGVGGTEIDQSVLNDDFFGGEVTTPNPQLQDGWAFCSKCASLFYLTAGNNVCPAGGSHSAPPGTSNDYSLIYTPPA